MPALTQEELIRELKVRQDEIAVLKEKLRYYENDAASSSLFSGCFTFFGRTKRESMKNKDLSGIPEKKLPVEINDDDGNPFAIQKNSLVENEGNPFINETSAPISQPVTTMQENNPFVEQTPAKLNITEVDGNPFLTDKPLSFVKEEEGNPFIFEKKEPKRFRKLSQESSSPIRKKQNEGLSPIETFNADSKELLKAREELKNSLQIVEEQRLEISKLNQEFELLKQELSKARTELKSAQKQDAASLNTKSATDEVIIDGHSESRIQFLESELESRKKVISHYVLKEQLSIDET